MRLASALAMFLFVSPALAADPDNTALTRGWTALPSLHFADRDRPLPVHLVTAHGADVRGGIVVEAFASAAKTAERRDLAIDELAAGWEPARRTALEDLRDAQRAYATVQGGDSNSANQRFVMLLKQVVDDSGRSVGRDPSSNGDALLNQTYDRVLRDASDTKLPAIEASEAAWIGYRDAFDRFAAAMDRTDAAKTVRDELARYRAEELQNETDH